MSNSYDKELEKWAGQINKGNKAAFEKMFLAYFEPLSKFAWRFVKSSHVAQELVQDVFLNIWENRTSLDARKNIKSYLYYAVRNEALNYIRDQETAKKYNEQIGWLKSVPVTQMHDFDEESEFVQQAKQAIKDLPEGARLIYKLNRKDGLTYREIAEVLEISPKTVESQMGRALKILRQRLSCYLPILTAFIVSKVV